MAEPRTDGLPRRALSTVRKRWRVWLRALHRDTGYLVVGLTFIYALSGIAINHIDDWNPNFEAVEETHHLGHAFSGTEEQIAAEVVRALGIDEQPSDAYFASENRLEVYLPSGRTLHVDTTSGDVFDEYQKPRFFLRVANWLHYNRGKKAWTYVADSYAVLLLFLATSGLFMLKGRKGFVGRGAVIVLVGAAVPVLYVVLSGGP